MTKQADMMAAKGYIRATDAARRVGVTPHAIYAWIERGEVEAVRVGAAWYVLASSLAKHVGPQAAVLLGLTKAS